MSYIQNLQESPILTKCITSGVLGFVEEFSAQSISLPNGYNWMWTKMFRMSLYGSLINAPMSHFLYSILNRFSMRYNNYSSLVTLAGSNLIVLPIQTYVYIAAMGYFVNQESAAETNRLIRKNFWPILLTSLKYFPIIQLLVFKFVPPVLWVPLFNLISVAFGVYVNLATKNTK